MFLAVQALPCLECNPRDVKHWSLTTLREKLITIGAQVTRHSMYVLVQLGEVAVIRNLFAAIFDRIERLSLPPPVPERVNLFETAT